MKLCFNHFLQGERASKLKSQNLYYFTKQNLSTTDPFGFFLFGSEANSPFLWFIAISCFHCHPHQIIVIVLCIHFKSFFSFFLCCIYFFVVVYNFLFFFVVYIFFCCCTLQIIFFDTTESFYLSFCFVCSTTKNSFLCMCVPAESCYSLLRFIPEIVCSYSTGWSSLTAWH